MGRIIYRDLFSIIFLLYGHIHSVQLHDHIVKYYLLEGSIHQYVTFHTDVIRVPQVPEVHTRSTHSGPKASINTPSEEG